MQWVTGKCVRDYSSTAIPVERLRANLLLPGETIELLMVSDESGKMVQFIDHAGDHDTTAVYLIHSGSENVAESQEIVADDLGVKTQKTVISRPADLQEKPLVFQMALPFGNK